MNNTGQAVNDFWDRVIFDIWEKCPISCRTEQFNSNDPFTIETVIKNLKNLEVKQNKKVWADRLKGHFILSNSIPQFKELLRNEMNLLEIFPCGNGDKIFWHLRNQKVAISVKLPIDALRLKNHYKKDKK